MKKKHERLTQTRVNLFLTLDKKIVCSTIVLQTRRCGMAKEATLQVRMDAQLKESVEMLYREMGTSFAEAVRIFAKQSMIENGISKCNGKKT